MSFKSDLDPELLRKWSSKLTGSTTSEILWHSVQW